MEILKKLSRAYHWLLRHEYLLLGLITAATVVVHLIYINQPNGIMFDEEHYVKDARSIIAGQGDFRPEHPPLGKLFIVAGMLMFGDTPFGWRIMGVLFGTIAIVFFYLICRELKLTRRVSLLATFLLAFDNMTWVQASIAMLDVYTLGTMMVAFWLYLKKQYPIAGLVAALSALTKLNGALVVPAMVLHWAAVRRDKPISFLSLLFIAPLSFAALLGLFGWMANGHFINPIDMINTMLSMSGSLTFANVDHPSMSRPWEWILPWQFAVKLDTMLMPYWYGPHYYSAISFTILAFIFPAVAYLVYRTVKGNAHGRLFAEALKSLPPRGSALFALSWFAGTYVVWIPLSLITNRVSFVFYFYPTVGAVCIAIAMGIYHLINRGEMKRGKLRKVMNFALPTYIVLHLAVFVALTPLTHFW